jgi:PAS domain S-box-containing protein
MQRWVHGRVAPDLDASGQLRGLYCTEYDIHDLKMTEQALAAREEQLRLFTDNIPDPVVYLDTDRRYTFVNEAFLNLNRLNRSAVIGKSLIEVKGVAAMNTIAPDYDRAFAGETVRVRARVHRRDGSGALDPRPHGAGPPDRRRDPGRLRRRPRRHRSQGCAELARCAREPAAIDHDGVPAPVAYIDRDERCQYVNRAFLQYFGLTAEEVASLRLHDVVAPTSTRARRRS